MKKVTFKGKKYNLISNPISKHAYLSFTATNLELEDVEFKGEKLTLISSFPAISTSVCDLQTQWLAKIATKYKNDINVIAISMDLPFTLSEWCLSHSSKNLTVLSDYKKRIFGYTSGSLIDNLFLLNRTALIVSKRGKVLYSHSNTDVHEHIPYDDIEDELNTILKEK